MRLARSRTAVVVCLLAALTLVVADVRGSGLGATLRGAVASVAGPAQGLLDAGSGPVRGLAGGATQPGRSAQDLEQANTVLREQLAAAARAELDQVTAGEFAAIAPPTGYRQVRAHVVGVSAPADLVASITIDVGSGSQVAVGAAVISPDGLVGVVETLAPNSATVRLVTDAAGAVGARVARTREVGMFRGTGRPESGTLELLDPLGRMRTKDLIVTLGSAQGSPFPRGLPIGRIAEITGSATSADRRAVVRTSVDFSALADVMVLVADQEQP